MYSTNIWKSEIAHEEGVQGLTKPSELQVTHSLTITQF